MEDGALPDGGGEWLVAYVRLVDTDQAQHWDSRGHFFAAAAEAMRRILIEIARRKGAEKHGGGATRIALSQIVVAEHGPSINLLAIDEALQVSARCWAVGNRRAFSC